MPSKFNFGSFGELSKGVVQKMVDSLRKSIEGYDHDSGWISVPSDGIVKHHLGALPKVVIISVSSDKRGSGFAHIFPTSVTSSSVTFTTASPYCRVLVQG